MLEETRSDERIVREALARLQDIANRQTTLRDYLQIDEREMAETFLPGRHPRSVAPPFLGVTQHFLTHHIGTREEALELLPEALFILC